MEEVEIQKLFHHFGRAVLRDLNEIIEKLRIYFFRNYVPVIPNGQNKMQNVRKKINEVHFTEIFNDMKREEIHQIEVSEYELERKS